MSNMTKEQKEQDSKFKHVYLDANLFIYSILDDEEIGDKARKVIENIKSNMFKGFTSILTLDEIMWAVQKILGKEKAVEVTNDFISMQNLEFLPVNVQTIKKAFESYKEGLNPRDAIHCSSMQLKDINIIISSDPDFDRIKGIKRVDFSK